MSSTIQPKSAVKIVLGAMTIGNGPEQSRISDIGEATKLLDAFQAHGHNEVDTSRVYGSGSSEEYLATMGWQERGIVMDTKIYPTAGRGFPGDQLSLRPEHLRECIHRSLRALNAKKVDMWYLHGKLIFDAGSSINLKSNAIKRPTEIRQSLIPYVR